MPTTSSQPASSSSAAASSSSGSGIGGNKTTTIIVAVVASVAGILLILVMIRYIRRHIKRKQSRPLPPVQPIAHHREAQVAQFEESKYNHGLAVPAFPPSGSNSDASLIHREYDSSARSTPQRLHSDVSLNLPTPAFFTRDSNTSIPSSPGPLSPETPISAGSSNHSHNSAQPLFPGPQRVIRPRPSSMVSTTSRKSSGATANTIRGAPHGPHSSVQVILPTPLALGLSPYGHAGAEEGGRSRVSSRTSVVDQWAGVSISQAEQERKRLSQRRSSWTEPRESTSTAHTFTSTSSNHSPQRPHSANASPSASPRASRVLPPSAFRERDHSLTPPPVPRIPSMYGQLVGPEGDQGRNMSENSRPRN